jgi:lysylphosphatidylglycerol synthetase-like protein (DUF2156 family)
MRSIDGGNRPFSQGFKSQLALLLGIGVSPVMVIASHVSVFTAIFRSPWFSLAGIAVCILAFGYVFGNRRAARREPMSPQEQIVLMPFMVALLALVALEWIVLTTAPRS